MTAYDKLRFEGQAVDEFVKFRNKNLYQKAFDLFKGAVQQRKQMREMMN